MVASVFSSSFHSSFGVGAMPSYLPCYPSHHDLHSFGKTHGIVTVDPRLVPPKREGPTAQRSVSFDAPLCSHYDARFKYPSRWQKSSSDDRVLRHLRGAAENKPKLDMYDNTVQQPTGNRIEQALTTQLESFRNPAHTLSKTSHKPLPPRRVPLTEQQRVATASLKDRSLAEIERAARFGLIVPDSNRLVYSAPPLNPPYKPSMHSYRSVVRPANYHRASANESFGVSSA